MQPDYKDLLRDLGLTEKQIERIVELNTEILHKADRHSIGLNNWDMYYSGIEAASDFRDMQEAYLETEGFIN